VVDAAGEIFGDAPNVAARVQALAEPETVLVTQACSVRWPACSLRNREAHALKGAGNAGDRQGAGRCSASFLD
jgi:class 3 adenylate cyclase